MTVAPDRSLALLVDDPSETRDGADIWSSNDSWRESMISGGRSSASSGKGCGFDTTLILVCFDFGKNA